jgi:hypothetical protein
VYGLGYLHRDVSFANILLGPTWNSDDWEKDVDTECAGILNDWDMAKDGSKEATGAGRTGTYPFIAVALLQNQDKRHTVSHDLESFFYVLIWIATLYDTNDASRKPVLDDAKDNCAKDNDAKDNDRAQYATEKADSQSSSFLAPRSEISARNLANSTKQELTRDGQPVKVCEWLDDLHGSIKKGSWSGDFLWERMKAQILPCWKSLVDSGILDGLRDQVCAAYRIGVSDAIPLEYEAFLKVLDDGYPEL